MRTQAASNWAGEVLISQSASSTPRSITGWPVQRRVQ
jgi:hypothetical protein